MHRLAVLRTRQGRRRDPSAPDPRDRSGAGVWGEQPVQKSLGRSPRSPGSQAHDSVKAAASCAPGEFVERLLPAMLEVMRLNALHDSESDEGLADGVWGLQIFDRQGDIDQELFASMAQALRLLAAADPGRAASAFVTLQAVPFESAWFILARGYLATPNALPMTRRPGSHGHTGRCTPATTTLHIGFPAN